MPAKEPKPKEPLLALLLSIIWGGLGQIYAGYWVRGILIIVLPAILTVGLMIYVISPQTSINFPIALSCIILAIGVGIWILFDAYYCARRHNAEHDLTSSASRTKKIGFIVVIVLLCILPGPATSLTMMIRNNYLQAFKIPAGSMRDTLLEGDRLLADKRKPLLKRLKRGDVIIFQYPASPQRDFVKRLIAFGGESVEIINGDVYVDNKLVTEPRIKNNFYYNHDPHAGVGHVTQVPDNMLFVLGDNSASSHDSRFWGFVPEENVIGIAYKIYWPPKRSGPIE